MNVGQLSLRDLEYFVACAQELHFGKAAIKLNVSQPTLSEQIKKLEGLIGQKLFERSNRSVKLTPQGKILNLKALKVLDLAQEFIRESKFDSEPLAGEFHLGAIHTVGPYFFPKVLGGLIKEFPKMDLIIHEGMTDELLKELEEGKLDAVIASDTFVHKNFRVYPLYFEPFYLATTNEYNFPLKAGRASIKDVKIDSLILLTEGNCLKDEALNFCSIKKNKTPNKLQATSLETLRYLVAAGNGYTIMPEMAVEKDHELKKIMKYFPFIEKSAGRGIVLVSRENYRNPDDIRLLVNKLKFIHSK
jgi:LysR family hydrogen peroxide-inducible transcriptional activator